MDYTKAKSEILFMLNEDDLIDAGMVKRKLACHYLTARNYLLKMVAEGILDIHEIHKAKYTITYYKFDENYNKDKDKGDNSANPKINKNRR